MDLGKEGRVHLFLTSLFFKFTVISSPLPMIVSNVRFTKVPLKTHLIKYELDIHDFVL